MTMHATAHSTLLTIAACFLTACRVDAQVSSDGVSPATPLPRAHSHNDYLHERPLLDALEQGFTSVEADVYLVDGELLVAHARNEIKQGWTLTRLYLDPLASRINQNGGRVFAGSRQGFTLLIDIKSEAASTYHELEMALAPYRHLLTRVEGGTAQSGAVEVIISGNRPRDLMLAQTTRLASFDGRISDLDSELPATFMPLVSERWGALSAWTGEGEMLVEEKARIARLVRQAHDKGCRVRFWATPESEKVWDALLEIGVDHINTDNLARLSKYLRKHDK